MENKMGDWKVFERDTSMLIDSGFHLNSTLVGKMESSSVGWLELKKGVETEILKVSSIVAGMAQWTVVH